MKHADRAVQSAPTGDTPTLSGEANPGENDADRIQTGGGLLYSPLVASDMYSMLPRASPGEVQEMDGVRPEPTVMSKSVGSC